MSEAKRQKVSKVIKSPKAQGLRGDEDVSEWKALVPLLYDWFAHHHLVWPSLSCRWGSVLEDRKHKYTQKLFLSEQTDGSAPNTLVVAHVDVVKQRVAAAQDISRFDYKNRSPFVRKVKTIIHPGEVNKIRDLASSDSIVLTHSDIPEVLLWDTDRQPGSAEGKDPVPDLVLAGHTEKAEFALATCRSAPLVLSGGQDRTVLLWSVEDHAAGSLQAVGEAVQAAPERTGGAAEAGGEGGEPKEGSGEGEAKEDPSSEAKPGTGSREGEGGGGGPKPALGERARAHQVLPRGVFRGHTATVNDVQFHPMDPHLFCSVADDCQLLFWDSRAPGNRNTNSHNTTSNTNSDSDSNAGGAVSAPTQENSSGNGVGGAGSGGAPGESSGGAQGPVMRVERAHDADVHCVDWNPLNAHMVVTGSADRTARVFDIRKIENREKGGADPEDSPASGSGPAAKGVKSKAVYNFRGGHTEAITCVQWCPDQSVSFATSAEDGLVNIWDGRLRGAQAKAEGGLPGLLFRHVGHRGPVSEFQWSPVDPWTVASVATNTTKGAGHSLQLWRVLDLIHRPAREALLELERFM